MTTTTHTIDLWDAAVPFQDFLDAAEQKADLWRSYAGRARVHPEERQRLDDLHGVRRIVVLAEDWCGDAIRSIPTMQALADASPLVELRVLNADAHTGVLSSRLTRGARAIPIAIVLDGEGREIGQWGPRPAPLQALLRAKISAEGPPSAGTKGEFYAEIMAWYARDKGRNVAQELLMLLERGE